MQTEDNTASRLNFTISFQMALWTQYRASRVLFHQQPIKWLGYGFFVGLPTIFFLLALFLKFGLSRRGSSEIPLWTGVLPGYAFMFVIVPLLHLGNVWYYRRQNRFMTDIQTYTLTPEGFEVHGETFDVKLKWNAVPKAIETKDFFFLFISASNAYFMPKKHIHSDTDIQLIRSILRSYLGNKARLKQA